MPKKRAKNDFETPNFYVSGRKAALWHAWIAMCIRLRQSYSGRLMGLIERDYREMGETENE